MAPVGFLLGQSLSRAVPVIQLGVQSYARRDDADSKSRDVARSGRPQALIVALWVVVLMLGAFGFGVSLEALIGSFFAMLCVSVVVGWYVQRRVGGLTGDFMGAIQQLAELGILFALVSA